MGFLTFHINAFMCFCLNYFCTLLLNGASSHTTAELFGSTELNSLLVIDLQAANIKLHKELERNGRYNRQDFFFADWPFNASRDDDLSFLKITLHYSRWHSLREENVAALLYVILFLNFQLLFTNHFPFTIMPLHSRPPLLSSNTHC